MLDEKEAGVRFVMKLKREHVTFILRENLPKERRKSSKEKR